MATQPNTTGAPRPPANVSQTIANATETAARIGLPGTDAALIAVCAACEALEGQIRGIYEGPNRIPADEQASKLAEPLEWCLSTMLPVVEAIQAQTCAGIHARVRWMAAHNSDGGFSWDGDGFAGRLLQATLRDAAALEIGGR